MQNNNITFFKSSQSYALIFCIVWGFHVRTLPAVPGCWQHKRSLITQSFIFVCVMIDTGVHKSKTRGWQSDRVWTRRPHLCIQLQSNQEFHRLQNRRSSRRRVSFRVYFTCDSQILSCAWNNRLCIVLGFDGLCNILLLGFGNFGWCNHERVKKQQSGKRTLGPISWFLSCVPAFARLSWKLGCWALSTHCEVFAK